MISGISSMFGRSASPGRPGDIDSQRSLEDFKLRVLDDQVFSVSGEGMNEKLQLVSNFRVIEIREGTSGYLLEPGKPLYHVRVIGPTVGELVVKFRGSVYGRAGYEQGSDGRLVIPKPSNYATYLAHQLAEQAIPAINDPTIDERFVFGAYVRDDGTMVVSDAVDYPHGRNECLAHRRTFASIGDKEVFHLIGDLQQDDSIRALLTWGLGSPLKCAMGWSYPHAEITADSGVGKSTIAEIFYDRLGWLRIAGPTEFGSMYRAKRAVANSVMPIQFQEMGRLSRTALNRAIQMLNLSFDTETTTHGGKGMTYVLVTPALMWGQDSGIQDIALTAKLIRMNLLADNKDLRALSRVQESSAVWPMRQWIEFLCDFANQYDVLRLVADKTESLRRTLSDVPYSETSNSGRTIANYAKVLVAREALNAFGVEVDIEDFVVGLLRRHLTEQTMETASVARQFLTHFLLEIQRPSGRNAFIFDLRNTGLFMKVENAMKALRGRGRRYDITSPRKLTEMLKAEGFGTASVQHRVGRIQSRFFFIPRQVLEAFDFRYDQT